jgi:hypothetical protein
MNFPDIGVIGSTGCSDHLGRVVDPIRNSSTDAAA